MFAETACSVDCHGKISLSHTLREFLEQTVNCGRRVHPVVVARDGVSRRLRDLLLAKERERFGGGVDVLKLRMHVLRESTLTHT